MIDDCAARGSKVGAGNVDVILFDTRRIKNSEVSVARENCGVMFGKS